MKKDRSLSTDAAGTEKSTDRIARRAFLEGTAKLLLAAGVAAGGVKSARAEDKADKADVGYQDSPNGGASCAGCKFYDGNGGCQVVAGEISPDGWCTAYVAS